MSLQPPSSGKPSEVGLLLVPVALPLLLRVSEIGVGSEGVRTPQGKPGGQCPCCQGPDLTWQPAAQHAVCSRGMGGCRPEAGGGDCTSLGDS